MGLLEKMARDLPVPHQSSTGSFALLESVDINDWSGQEESKLVETMSQRRAELCLDSPVALADNVQLLVNSSAMHSHSSIFIVINGQIEYELDEQELPQWSAVIQKIDGQQSFNQIAKALGVSIGQIRKHIEEALDYSLLKFVV